MLSRLRAEKGFGLLELLMAMTMLNIGILAIVAAFNSGTVAITRASHISTASALADAQMERYRAIAYSQIALNDAAVQALSSDTTYTGDAALTANSGGSAYDLTETLAVPTAATACTASPVPIECTPRRDVTGPDHHPYRIDTYVTWSCNLPGATLSDSAPDSKSAPKCTPPTGTTTTSRPVKRITVVVRDRIKPILQPWARVTSTFDQSTGY